MSFYQTYTDQDLISAIQKDDDKAFTELVKRYWRRSHANAYARVHSNEIAEEIVQDLFLNLWNRRASLKISNVSSYFYACIKNKCITYIESQILQQKYWDYYKKFIPQSEKTTEQSLDYSSLVEAIEEGLDQLPQNSKKVFTLNRLEGRSINEIASLLNLSTKTIEYHLTRSLKKLRVHLKDFTISVALICSQIF